MTSEYRPPGYYLLHGTRVSIVIKDVVVRHVVDYVEFCFGGPGRLSTSSRLARWNADKRGIGHPGNRINAEFGMREAESPDRAES